MTTRLCRYALYYLLKSLSGRGTKKGEGCLPKRSADTLRVRIQDM
nr:hypothetical protein [uncultured Porphyromonas sp.]